MASGKSRVYVDLTRLGFGSVESQRNDLMPTQFLKARHRLLFLKRKILSEMIFLVLKRPDGAENTVTVVTEILNSECEIDLLNKHTNRDPL